MYYSLQRLFPGPPRFRKVRYASTSTPPSLACRPPCPLLSSRTYRQLPDLSTDRLAIRCCGDGKPYRFILRDRQYEETGIQFETIIQVSFEFGCLSERDWAEDLRASAAACAWLSASSRHFKPFLLFVSYLN